MACAEFPTAGLTPNVSTHVVDGVTYLWTGVVWEVDESNNISRSILIAQGYSGDYGFFEEGFTYSVAGDIGIDADGNSWIYVGAGAPVKVVTTGTVPSVATGYEQVTFNSMEASSVSNDTGGSVQDYINSNMAPLDSTLDIPSLSGKVSGGERVSWLGYYEPSDGGSNWGIVKTGPHTEDGGSIFTIDSNAYLEANFKNKKFSIKKFGGVGDGSTDNTGSFRNAWVAAKEARGVFYVPSGVFQVTNKESVISDLGDIGVTVIGDGEYTSIIKREYSINKVGDAQGDYQATGNIFDFPSGAKNLEFKDLGFLGYNSFAGDPTLPASTPQRPSFYNNSGADISIENTDATTNTIDNVKISKVHSTGGYANLYLTSQDSTATNIQVDNLTKLGGYYGIAVLGAYGVNVNNLVINSLNDEFDFQRGFYCASSKVMIDGMNMDGAGAVGLYIRAYAPYKVNDINVNNIHVKSSGAGISIECTTDSTIQNINISNFTSNCTVQNPSGGLSITTVGADVPAPPINNINISNWCSYGAGLGLYFGTDNSTDPEYIGVDGLTIDGVNIGKDGITGSTWLKNGSDVHGTKKMLVKNAKLTSVNVSTGVTKTFGTLQMKGFIDSYLEITTNSQNPVDLYGNKRLRIDMTADYGVDHTNETLPVLVNGRVGKQTTIYVDDSVVNSDKIKGDVSSPMSEFDFYKYMAWFSKYQKQGGYPSNSTRFILKGSYNFNTLTGFSISGLEIDGVDKSATFSNVNLTSSSQVVFMNLSTDNIVFSNCVGCAVVSSNISGNVGVRSNNSSILVNSNNFSTINAMQSIGAGSFINASNNTGSSSSIAYYAESGGVINHRSADSLNGVSDTMAGGNVTTF